MNYLLSAPEEKLNKEAFGELPGPRGIDFYCKKCRKSMRISYALTGDRTAPAMNGIMIKCHTHKCTRVVTLKNFTEGQIVERTDALGKCYL